ncbi:hypothetical protein KVH02_34520 [Streptomyces olivaceus]|uniref:Uncharacterized protein n=1 Tax=Streptomyces olivaceus TaxID=47716 RepID=A0ABS7WE27_STROV|nr:hypothetical protein [Streptomyces olivaceus]MBZ6093382.1 hypothetical protein [Streptomyces olivaceus]MBZ6100748.1 hypothetical protein [Streptomyces olivaceus]MBZ6121846.1 hypothetical protein [Streptomyces olivaceus]MBZ6156215.1 hypothetical protein [Streptomyces olivaceus]MBZ6303110.1 hypothetical protein [Streptomyces olivaceus]
MNVCESLEQLDRVRFDLESAGLLQPPAPALPSTDDEAQGGPVVYIDDGQVHVDWLCHARLNDASLDMVEVDREEDDVVRRYDAVRVAMHTALGVILHGFGYHLDAPHFGYGYTIRPAHHDFPTAGQELS